MSQFPRVSKAILMLGGVIDLPLKDVIEIFESTEWLACADGAAEYAVINSFVPNVVIGDMDSISAETVRELKEEDVPFVKLEDQSTSDCEKSLEWLLSIGVSQLIVLGVGGGRGDHALANYSVLIRYAEKFKMLKGVERENDILFLPHGGELAINGWPGRRVSFIPFPAAMSMRSTGLKYPMIGDYMIGGRESLSNVMLESTAKLTCVAGAMIAFMQRKKGR